MTKKNKSNKKNQNKDEKNYLTNVIKHLEMCADYNKGTDLEGYFKRKAALNRQRLKELK